MKVSIKVVAMDHENGVKKTYETMLDVPTGILRMTEMVAGDDPSERVMMIANSVFMGAKRELDVGQNSKSRAALTEQLGGGGGGGGGPIGARPAPAGGRDPLADALGLDLIEHMSSGGQPAQGPSGPARAPQGNRAQPHEVGPGPIGFPTTR